MSIANEVPIVGYIVMACVVMAHVVVAYVVMARIVVAFIVMAYMRTCLPNVSKNM